MLNAMKIMYMLPVLCTVFLFARCAAVPEQNIPAAPDEIVLPVETVSPPTLPIAIARGASLEEARLEAALLKKSDEPRNYSSPAVFANFREIRFGAIAQRRLYRSSHPALPGNPRFSYAQQLAENAHVRAVLNLVDTEARAALYADNIPWYQNFIDRKTIITLDMGVDYTDPAFEAKIKKALLFIVFNGGPYLIHGNEGRDRTGFLAALLEALMGASPEEIIADYMKSYENYYHLTEESDQYRVITVIAEDILLTIAGRGPSTAEAAAEYLRRIGLTNEEITALKERLL
jgi:hypothetical protein